jgi:hypothetical protein
VGEWEWQMEEGGWRMAEGVREWQMEEGGWRMASSDKTRSSPDGFCVIV